MSIAIIEQNYQKQWVFLRVPTKGTDIIVLCHQKSLGKKVRRGLRGMDSLYNRKITYEHNLEARHWLLILDHLTLRTCQHTKQSIRCCGVVNEDRNHRERWIRMNNLKAIAAYQMRSSGKMRQCTVISHGNQPQDVTETYKTFVSTTLNKMTPH